MTKKETQLASIKHILIDKAHLEPYLKFPSGLSIQQAKNNAKALKKAQGITQSEALKIICWGNGIVDVRDYSQAFDQIVFSTLGRKYDEIGLTQKGEEIVGCWWSTGDGNHKTLENISQSLTGYNYEEEVSNNVMSLVRVLTSEKEQQYKPKLFLKAVIDCIEFLEHDFYNLPRGRSLKNLDNINELNIDLDRLLFECDDSSGAEIMSYILASCYNASGAARRLMENSLDEKHQSDRVTMFDISDVNARKSLADYADDNCHFGAMCRHLDNDNKDIVKRLLDNYQGW